jgi:capsule biosynthesis phosphatase
VFVGKPWCGHEGFYVDDKTVRPDEFATMSYSEIRTKLGLRQPPGQ